MKIKQHTKECDQRAFDCICRLEFRLPNYDTTFTFSIYRNGEEIWNDNNTMPHSLRELIIKAVSSHQSLLEIVKELRDIIKNHGDLQLGPKGRHHTLERRVLDAIANAEGK